METIAFELGEERSDFKKNVTIEKYEKNPLYFARYFLNFPCEKTYECTYYHTYFPAGVYSITICGANGGVVTSAQKTENKNEDFPYAAGCTSGIISLARRTKMYIHLGGYGLYDGNSKQRSHGGYNGGGSGNFMSIASTGGGGASDIRAEENDVFHRIIVAGGGGGGDSPTTKPEDNDGCGGSGGGLTAKGWYVSSSKTDDKIAANQTFGFSFGQGEAGKVGPSNNPQGSTIKSYNNDLAGAGGGWFGGFASHHENYGAGGGSSFILTENAVIPTDVLITSDENYTNQKTGRYAFFNSRKYLFYSPTLKRGVWFGNGYAEIMQYRKRINTCREARTSKSNNLILMSIL